MNRFKTKRVVKNQMAVVLLFALLFFQLATFAQSPQKMSYQAVVRNSNDALVVNSQNGMQIR